VSRAIQEPLDETLKEARRALDPSKSAVQPEGETTAAGTDVVLEPTSESQEPVEAGKAEQDQPTDVRMPDGAEQQTDPGDNESQPVSAKEPGEATSPGGPEDEHASE
jgi:hypothetical protein